MQVHRIRAHLEHVGRGVRVDVVGTEVSCRSKAIDFQCQHSVQSSQSNCGANLVSSCSYLRMYSPAVEGTSFIHLCAGC